LIDSKIKAMHLGQSLNEHYTQLITKFPMRCYKREHSEGRHSINWKDKIRKNLLA